MMLMFLMRDGKADTVVEQFDMLTGLLGPVSYTHLDVYKRQSKKLSTIDGVLSTGTHFIMRRYKDSGMNLIDFEGSDERSLIL